MQEKRFQKRVENFVCEHCGERVRGSGYTNHCPHCLWSKHVDVNPGDRAQKCAGMMEPVRVEGSSPDYALLHRCVRCGCTRSNKVASEDDAATVVALAQKVSR